MLFDFLQDYLSIIIFLIIALGLSLAFITLNFILSPKNPDPEKLSAYECGFEAFDDSRIGKIWLWNETTKELLEFIFLNKLNNEKIEYIEVSNLLNALLFILSLKLINFIFLLKNFFLSLDLIFETRCIFIFFLAHILTKLIKFTVAPPRSNEGYRTIKSLTFFICSCWKYPFL